MSTKVKIKINDDTDLREKLDNLYEQTTQEILAKWSIGLAKYILSICGIDYQNEVGVVSGFEINELWQKRMVRVHDVRQAGFEVHALAKSTTNEIHKNALRVAGQAVGTGHMKEHAMVASDYAIKVINLLYPNDLAAVTAERQRQISELSRYL